MRETWEIIKFVTPIVVLFGSLVWTVLTYNPWPFVIGYPIAFTWAALNLRR